MLFARNAMELVHAHVFKITSVILIVVVDRNVFKIRNVIVRERVSITNALILALVYVEVSKVFPFSYNQ